MEVTVIRSTKRRKTAQARLVEGRLEVRIPARSSKAEEARLVEGFRKRFERSTAGERVDLAARARRLAKAHDLPRPTDIRWVTNQAHRWGSCTPSTGAIRISDRLADHPTWVIDLVVVHELAHLVERSHDARFHALVARYPLAERAEGYLLALGGGASPTEDPLAGDLDEGALDGEAPPVTQAAPAIPLGPGDDAPVRPAARDRRRPPSATSSIQLPLDL
ncbi:hypothetical protein BH10ACT1_BH10ACT1_39670 [soil metagenome]